MFHIIARKGTEQWHTRKQGEILRNVSTEDARRQRLGEIIEREVGRRWQTKTAAELDLRVSHATLHRVTTGQPVGDVMLDKVEKGLQLPRDLFRHFLAGDRDEIEAMPLDGDSPGWDADLKRVLLKALDIANGSIQKLAPVQTAT